MSEASLVAVTDDNKDANTAEVCQYHPPTAVEVAQRCPEPVLPVATCESLASSSDDSSAGCAIKKPCTSTKEVSFSGFVQVMLIPCIVEYKDAGLCEIIWWTPADMNRFKVETIMSVQKYMMATQVRNIKVALRMLLEAEADQASPHDV